MRVLGPFTRSGRSQNPRQFWSDLVTKPPGKNGLPADQWDFTQWRFPQLVRPKTQGSQLESGYKTRKEGALRHDRFRACQPRSANRRTASPGRAHSHSLQRKPPPPAPAHVAIPARRPGRKRGPDAGAPPRCPARAGPGPGGRHAAARRATDSHRRRRQRFLA